MKPDGSSANELLLESVIRTARVRSVRGIQGYTEKQGEMVSHLAAVAQQLHVVGENLYQQSENLINP